MAPVTQGYRLEMARSHAVLRLEPEMGSAAWGDIDRVGNELIEKVNGQSSPAWLIDLSSLEYMGSALVALVVRVWKAVHNSGGKVVVVCGGGMPQEVLRLAGLDKVWTISTTYEDGLRKLGVTGPSGGGGGGGVASTVGAETGFPLLAVLSLICAVAAGIAFAMVISGRPLNRDLISAALLGGGVAAAVLGCVSLLKEQGWGRGLGGLSALAGVVIAFAGYSKLPPAGQPAPAPAPLQDQDQQDASADEDTESAVHFDTLSKDAHA